MIRYIKIGLCGLYNIWFYTLAATGIIISLPLFFIFCFKEEWYPQFYWVARNIWAKLILFGMGLIPKIEFSCYDHLLEYTSLTNLPLLVVLEGLSLMYIYSS